MHHQKPLIGIKGKLQSRNYETDNNDRKYILEVIAEKVTFLSSKKQEEVNERKADK